MTSTYLGAEGPPDCFDVNRVWLGMLDAIFSAGRTTQPRGMITKELIGHRVLIDMTRPVITLTHRKMGYKFMAAAAKWILEGDDRVETIAPYSKTVSQFSDDGKTFFGAYGPKIKAQLPYVIASLKKDPDTRQAVINIWRESPGIHKDIPCTVSHQFLIREGKLEVVTTMRSNDAWLGFVYDVFDVVMLATYVLLELGRYDVTLGMLTHTAGSRHLYERDFEGAQRCLADPTELFTYESLQPYEFMTASHLLTHLWGLAHKQKDSLRGHFLQELLTV